MKDKLNLVDYIQLEVLLRFEIDELENLYVQTNDKETENWMPKRIDELKLLHTKIKKIID